MTEIKLYKSPQKAIRLILLCTPFVLIGIWLLSIGENITIAWLSVLFFGLGYPISIFNLLDKRPQIIINEIGIFDRTINKEIINWELIKGAYLINIKGQKFISLIVDERFKPSKNKGIFYKNISKLNEMLGAQELNINLGQIKIDEIKLTEFILAMSKADKSVKSNLLNSFNEK